MRAVVRTSCVIDGNQYLPGQIIDIEPGILEDTTLLLQSGNLQVSPISGPTQEAEKIWESISAYFDEKVIEHTVDVRTAPYGGIWSSDIAIFYVPKRIFFELVVSWLRELPAKLPCRFRALAQVDNGDGTISFSFTLTLHQHQALHEKTRFG
jgi:hypothetical protein